ncbi:MAG: hypothetical protein PHI98_11875 [Eubacteriales bacterium]|nr:hypothetical protein [Eubacteriales bacterium]
MNGFTNALLSMLLSWIRLLVNQLWNLLNSQGGYQGLHFLIDHWKTIAVFLCISGFVVDRIVYLIRWRPYYVWSSKLHRLERRRGKPTTETAPVVQQPLTFSPHDAAPAAAESNAYYAPPFQQSDYAPPPSPAPAVNAATTRYAAPLTDDAAYRRPTTMQRFPTDGATVQYAPIAQGIPLQPYSQPYIPPTDLEPVFDDDAGDWGQGDELVKPLHESIHEMVSGMDASFGSAKPEPVAYLRDMQAGFAKPLPPQQLYSAPVAPPVAPEEIPAMPDPTLPVHPGLDMANFRRNIGLTPAAPLRRRRGKTEPQEIPITYDNFSDFRQAQPEPEQTARSHNPFSSLAKKARDFVGVSDDDERSIHDLQPTVDIRTAFHEPVYPKHMRHKENNNL